MASLAEYFSNNRYKAQWQIGDRVFGKYNKIPFIGTVGNDTLINEIEGPRVSVHLDLPLKVDDEYKSYIIVKPKELKRLISMDEELTSSVKQTKEKKNEKHKR